MSLLIIQTKPRNYQKRKLIIVVGKDIIKKATQRNLIKRRLRSIFNNITKESLESADSYKVFIKKKEILNLSFDDLKKEVELQINKPR